MGALPSRRHWFQFSLRTMFVAVVLIAGCLGGMNWAFRRTVPYGVHRTGVIAYLIASSDRGIVDSPNSLSRVQIVANDGGAVHSGRFWTWIIVDRWWGREVVAQGYFDDHEGDIPLKWVDDNSFDVEFSKNRYGSDRIAVHVEL